MTKTIHDTKDYWILLNKHVNMNRDNKYLDRLENISFQPIFILGFHRSGTTILYKMLASTKCFNIITAYHVIKYDQLLYNHINNKEETAKQELNKFLKEHGQVDRGIDRQQLSADFPEEYRFIFTEKSYKPMITSNNLWLFIELCKKIQFVSENDRPLLLKNPFDFPNFMIIKKVFPKAKFIFIHRNPIKVINSSIKSINNLFEKKNLYTALLSKNYEKVVDNLLSRYLYRFYLFSTVLTRSISEIKGMARISEYYLTSVDTLDQEDYISIRYEDLCENPKTVMSNLMNFLTLKTKTKIDYSRFIKTRETILLKELQQLYPYMVKKMKKYLSYCGYAVENMV